jgi:MYXO-CTERM domain-containing protein
VQCLSDADCPSSTPAQICEPNKKICVDCTATNTRNCSSNGAGAICLDANNTCGCSNDTHCGGPNSGRVCHRVLTKCVPGCRGTGGNGCPSGFRCTSTNDEIGVCERIPPPDAAVPDAMPDVMPDVAPDMMADAPQPDAGVDAGEPDASIDLRPIDTAVAIDTRPPVDAFQIPDARPPVDSAGAVPNFQGYVSGGGLGCAVASGGRPTSGALWLTLVPVGVALVIRRRRRR